MSDEILAHRLGLIPLITDLDRYVLPEDCTCKSEFGCNKCRVVLSLDAEPKESTVIVYSGDIKSEDPNVRPVQEKIPLTKLVSGQRVRLEAYARLGKGKNHARWQSVSACYYRYLPEVKISSKNCNLCGKCVKVCPRGVLSVEGGSLVVKNLMDCTLCEDCVRACPLTPPAIKIAAGKGSFIFEVESTGALPVDRLILEAAEILADKTRTLMKQLKENAD
jgi:DNA-directed RNA polymerase subunit D